MKVLHVIPSMSEARGGPAVVLQQMMRGLMDRGVDVCIATTDDDGPNARKQHPEGTGAIYYFPRQTRFYTFSWPLRQWLVRHIREFDLVHIHALFSYPSAVAAWIARNAGVPYVIRPLGTLSRWGLSMRRPMLKQWSLSWIERPTLRAAAAVQATSEQERNEVLAACPECTAVVIPNPVEMPEDFARPKRAAVSSILYLSRIDPKKGLELLLDAFERIAERSSLELVIAGDGETSYVDTIRRKAAASPAAGRIRFTGDMRGERKRALFSEADLFVLASHSENFGVAVVEAMAHGVPVLISQNVGIAEEVRKANAGVVVASESTAIAAAISELTADSEKLRKMGENGRRFAMEHYSRGKVADSLIALYERVMRG